MGTHQACLALSLGAPACSMLTPTGRTYCDLPIVRILIIITFSNKEKFPVSPATFDIDGKPCILRVFCFLLYSAVIVLFWIAPRALLVNFVSGFRNHVERIKDTFELLVKKRT